MITRVVTTEQRPLDELREYPGNARRGNVEVVRESLRVHGQYKPIVVQQSTGYILAGNHTAKAARAEGWDTLLVSVVDCDDEQARKINLVDNRSNDLADYDYDALGELLSAMDGDLTGTGFDAQSVDELLASLGGGGWSADRKDAAPPLGDTAITQLGDVIDLGPHRLVCGDARDPGVRAAALGARMADLVVTDPPYMVNFSTYDSEDERRVRKLRTDQRTVGNDALSGSEADLFICDSMAAVRDSLKAGGAFYIFSPPGEDELRFRLGLRDAGLQLRQTLLWVKDRFVFGRQDYQWRHESLLYGWRDGAAHYFVDDHTQDTIWECDRPARSKEHPTMKPVALLERAIENSSRKGELVLDLFGGSGSTLVAAASTGRKAALIELDPLYCDVIVRRYEDLTGLTVRQ